MNYINSLEPAGLIQHFMNHPPEGFGPLVSSLGQPGFFMRFDLLTTADAEALEAVNKLPASGLLRKLLTWRTLFFGTTVSEYAPMIAGCDAPRLLATMMDTWGRQSRLLIIKDIPDQSPLLPESDRQTASALREACQQSGFTMIAGQALAYVPIDFASSDDYLARLSSGRRKDIRRKLKVRADLRVDILRTGCEELQEAGFLQALYDLYEEVYAQSEIHFDKLTAGFFRAILQDASLDGYLFLYYRQGALIGFNLCFIHNNMLIDKYVGFRYPEARECNLYFVSWMENLEFAIAHQLTHYVAGWTDPEIKAYLGAKFTFTHHAVYPRNRVLRMILGKLSHHFEHDKTWFDAHQR
jgi:predicted N-acyltransferase